MRRELGMFVALVVMCLGLWACNEAFFSASNVANTTRQVSLLGIFAIGIGFVIITGGIDLSVGAVVALVTVVTMRVYTHFHSQLGVEQASLLAVMCGVLIGGVCGLLNGLLITQLGLPPFVVTLGMLSVARGSAIWVAERTVLAFPADTQLEWVKTLARSRLTNPGFLSLIVLAVLIAVILWATRFGRHLYAVGSNEATARLCGVNVTRTKLIVYTLAGLLTGWAGVILFAHSNSGNPTLGEQLELDVITAVVIGGASLSGGRGTVIGAMLGVAILGLIKNGVSLFDVPVEMQYILIGVLLLANVSLNVWRQRRSKGAEG
jgi:ribose transport system permease protein